MLKWKTSRRVADIKLRSTSEASCLVLRGVPTAAEKRTPKKNQVLRKDHFQTFNRIIIQLANKSASRTGL